MIWTVSVPREVVLPLVEQLDPALVPEYFWRIVAARSPVGDPRSGTAFVPAALTLLLASYDREAAAVVFEPVRAWLEHADERELARPVVPIAFQAWSVFDPRTAVATLGQLPVIPDARLGQTAGCRITPTAPRGTLAKRLDQQQLHGETSWLVISGESERTITPSAPRPPQTPAPSQTTPHPRRDKAPGRRHHPADPAGRSAVRSRTAAAVLRLPRNSAEVGLNQTRGERIDADTVLAKLAGPRPGHHDQARLGEAIEQAAGLGLQARDRAHVDDRAARPRSIILGTVSRIRRRAALMLISIILSSMSSVTSSAGPWPVGGAVVDQDVDRPEPRLDVFHQGLDLIELSKMANDRHNFDPPGQPIRGPRFRGFLVCGWR